MRYSVLGLIGAMDEEIVLLSNDMKKTGIQEKAGIQFVVGSLSGHRVVLCRSGVGKVNAAVTTQILIESFGVEAVIFTGVAGALDPELEVGDVVISKDSVQHDLDATALGYPKGTIPFQETSEFPADPELVSIALEAGKELNGSRVVVGRVLSGDQFVADPALVGELRDRHGGSCTEMEGAAVAQVCHMNGIPHVVIRSMSDKADGSAPLSFAEFTKVAARNSYIIVSEMLKKIS